MRPIKFRAWYKEDTQMRDVLAVNFYHRVLSAEYEGDQFVQDGMNRFILMQYTGLKDKNGVEIYEGDIIKLIGTYKDSKGKELGRFKVVWNDYYTGFYPLIDDHLRGNIEWEVIGNIYEHPELLKEQNK